MNPSEQQAVREVVREGYAAVAQGRRSCCGPSPSPRPVEVGTRFAEKLGYAADQLDALPEGADMGLSCGNPTALASLHAGEVVLDLGSGGGFDCFVAGPRVGPRGRVIGVDMTPEMLAKARKNVAAYRKQSGLDNVEFRLGEIEHLPVADASVDVVISNCVLNLSPDKPQVWREIARVLRPGGRVAVSDLALLNPLPQQVREMVEALVGCVAGAVLVEETRRLAAEAGLVNIVLTPKAGYVDALAELNDPLYQKIAAALPAGSRMSEYITSLNVEASKP